MCINCAFSIEDKPYTCALECMICSHNPALYSKVFKPIEYKGHVIQKPIDMFISREFYAIIQEEIKKAMNAYIPVKPDYPIPDNPWFTPRPSPWSPGWKCVGKEEGSKDDVES